MFGLESSPLCQTHNNAIQFVWVFAALFHSFQITAKLTLLNDLKH